MVIMSLKIQESNVYSHFEKRMEFKPFFQAEHSVCDKRSDKARWVFLGFIGNQLCHPENEDYLKRCFDNKIYNIIPVTRRDVSGETVYNGCVHAMTDNVDELISLFDGRIVIDRKGTWYANSDKEMFYLQDYFINRGDWTDVRNTPAYPEISLRPVVVGPAIDQQKLDEELRKKLARKNEQASPKAADSECGPINIV